jgi:signal transduction histidine kinase
MRWGIRYQLLVPLLILLLGVVGISTWTALASAARARGEIEARVRDIARTANKAPFPNERILELMKGLSEADYLVDDPQEGVLTTLGVQVKPDGLPAATARWEELRLGPPVSVHGKTYLCNAVRVQPPSGRTFTLYIFYPESLLQDALWAAVRPSLILGVFGGLASIALAVGMAHRLGRRIQDLERRTRQIASGDFSPMPLPGRNDELRDLGRSVNDMAERLARLQETVRTTERFRLLGQVSGGLAHQLRNGVTGARLAVQLHARACDNSAEPEALEVALRQLALVETHLKRFLDLGNQSPADHRPHSLAALLDETIALLQPLCKHAQIDLRWQPPSDQLTVRGDAGQLSHLFLNVIGNAIDATGPGGWVEVRLQIADCRLQIEKQSAICNLKSAIIEVSDSGPGPPPDLAPRLFEPFVTGKREGVGLGLAVSRQVAEAHGGRISWDRTGDHTCFRIELPIEEGCLAETQRRQATSPDANQ